MVFAGVGLIALPLDCIKAFIQRPKSTISRSEFVKRAQLLGQRAKQIKATFLPLPQLTGKLYLGADAETGFGWQIFNPCAVLERALQDP